MGMNEEEIIGVEWKFNVVFDFSVDARSRQEAICVKICMITVKLVYIVVTPPLLEFDNLFLGFFKCEMLLAIYTKVSNETRHWNYKKKTLFDHERAAHGRAEEINKMITSKC